MCTDRGAVLLSLKDQPIVDKQEGLGEGSASCVLSLTHLCPPCPPGWPAISPDQAPWGSRAPVATLTTLLWDHRSPARWWSFKGVALSPAAQAPPSPFLSGAPVSF